MFVSNRSIRRALASAGAAVATVGTVVALSASPALAASTGQAITGSGSSLQGSAQSALSTAFGSAGSSVNLGGSVAYTSTSSGDGLAVFGDAGATINGHVFNAGQLNPGAGNATGDATVLNGFIGTDDAPAASLISNGETAADEANPGTIKQITLPVLQAPVAVIFSLPSGVNLSSGVNLKLTNQLLDQIWTDNVPASTDYSANTWGAILENAHLVKGTDFTDPSNAGNVAFTLVARSSGSGTTFTFRGYLNEAEDLLHSNNLSDYTYNDGDVSDSDAEATSTTGGWPVPVTETSATSGGSGLVGYVKANAGTIGYANLADALSGGFRSTETAGGASQQIIYAEIQDNGVSSSPAYADPSKEPSNPTATGSGSAGNVYTGTFLNNSANIGTGNGDGFWTVPTTNDGTWAGTPAWGEDPYNITVGNPTGKQPGEVAAADDPDVAVDATNTRGSSGVGDYPLVAATYDEAFSDYVDGNVASDLTAESQSPQDVANTVTAYFNFVYSATGQGDIATGGYASLPSGALSSVEANQLKDLPGNDN
jgi:hypothetical protein